MGPGPPTVLPLVDTLDSLKSAVMDDVSDILKEHNHSGLALLDGVSPSTQGTKIPSGWN